MFVCLLVFRTLMFLKSPGQLFCIMPLNLDVSACLLMVMFLARMLHRYFCDMLSAHTRRHVVISLITQLRWCPHTAPFPRCLYCELINDSVGRYLETGITLFPRIFHLMVSAYMADSCRNRVVPWWLQNVSF